MGKIATALSRCRVSGRCSGGGIVDVRQYGVEDSSNVVDELTAVSKHRIVDSDVGQKVAVGAAVSRPCRQAGPIVVQQRVSAVDHGHV